MKENPRKVSKSAMKNAYFGTAKITAGTKE